MLRVAITAAFILLLGSCAHERSRDPSHPMAVATAQVIIRAVAPAQTEDYRWEAVANRAAIEWLPATPDTENEGQVRREGRLSATATERVVIALGDEANVATLSIGTDAIHALALLDALRQAGAEVSLPRRLRELFGVHRHARRR